MTITDPNGNETTADAGSSVGVIPRVGFELGHLKFQPNTIYLSRIQCPSIWVFTLQLPLVVVQINCQYKAMVLKG